MAVETNQVHSATRRGHDARPSDRSGVGSSGKLGAQAPQSGGFLGLLSSLQAEDSDNLPPGAVDATTLLVSSWGGDTPQPGTVQPVVSDATAATLNLAGSVAPSWTNPLVPSSGPRWGGQEQVAKLGGSDAGASSFAASFGQRDALPKGEDAAALTSLPCVGETVRQDASFAVDAASGAQIAEAVAGKTAGKGLHGKPAGASSLSSTTSNGVQSPVAHWSKSLGDADVRPPVLDGGSTQWEAGRQSGAVVAAFKEASVASRPELATTVLFGGAESRQLSKDEWAKPGREATAPGVLLSETENLGISVDAQVLDPSNTAATDEDPAKYWMGGETRHSAELKVDEMAGGPVEISIQLQGNEATIAFKADGQQAQDALLSGSRDLEKLLGQEGMVLSSLSVGTSSAQGGGQGFGGNFSSQPYGGRVLEKTDSNPAAPATVGQSARRPQGVVDHFV